MYCERTLVDDLLCDDASSPPFGSHRQYSSGLSIPWIVCEGCVCVGGGGGKERICT